MARAIRAYRAASGDGFRLRLTVLRALDVPRPARVTCDDEGVPQTVTLDGRSREVMAIRDDWLVQDLWWTGRPVDRRYFEVVVEPGRVVTAYREGGDGSWFIHSGGS